MSGAGPVLRSGVRMRRFEHVPTEDVLEVRRSSEAELIAGARLGKDAHVGALRERYGPLVRDVAETVAPTAATEVVDDVFLAMPRLLAGYTSEQGKFVAWLRQVVRSRARTVARSIRARERREVTLPSQDLHAAHSRTFGRTAEEREVKDRVLNQLGERERAVCELFAAGYRHAEIGTRLGITEANSQQIVSRVKKRLLARYRDLASQ